MTPDQMEMLRPGMEVVTFVLDFDAKPPYKLDACLIPQTVAGISNGRGGKRIHVKHTPKDEFGHDVLGPDNHRVVIESSCGPDEVFASMKSASDACLAAINGLDTGIKDLKARFSDQVKAEREKLRGDRPAVEPKPPKLDAEGNPIKRKGGRPRKPKPEDIQAALPLAASAADAPPDEHPPEAAPEPAPEAPDPLQMTQEAPNGHAHSGHHHGAHTLSLDADLAEPAHAGG